MLLVAGCLAIPPAPIVAGALDETQTAKSLLRRVTLYVAAALKDDPAASTLDGEELVRWALRRKPVLLSRLDDYRITARRSLTGREAILLLCHRRSNAPWFEDATCTPTIDRERMAVGRQQPCAFTLKSEDICGIR